MGNITVYIPNQLHQVLKWHRGLNKSKIVAEALHKEISTRNCSCDRCSDTRIKDFARRKVHAALRSGKLKKLPCLKCGELNSEAHHPDHKKPLEVVWLCRKHHREVEREAKNEVV